MIKSLLRCALGLVCVGTTLVCNAQSGTWSFAVSGDSRNCGDIVMPAIARKVRADHARFYWHLGDYRAFYNFDEDMLAANHGTMGVVQYESSAWPDFIAQQLTPFAEVPVFLALGNHELAVKTRAAALIQFSDWFNAPAIRAQRLADDPADHALRSYYHWHEHNVDFITLDNASPEQFDAEQIAWFEGVLKRDEEDRSTRTVILGMHDALPDSLSAGHSMNESAVGTVSGRRVYEDLLAFQRRTGKETHVLASHSHFVMSDVYKTSCRKPQDVLSGWIVGTAGATRYRLPVEHSEAGFAQTDVYGYLLGSVDKDGHVTFHYQPVEQKDVAPETLQRYGNAAVNSCFTANRANYVPSGPVCTAQ